MFIDAQVSALHVSDRNGPSSGASLRCCMCRLCYVLIRPAGTTFEEELSSTRFMLNENFVVVYEIM